MDLAARKVAARFLSQFVPIVGLPKKLEGVSVSLVTQIVELQTDCVVLWHDQSIISAVDPEGSGGLVPLILVNHEINFRLWHEEDLARDPDATDTKIANVKRNIDRLNQRRSDAVESIDNGFAVWLSDNGVTAKTDERNTETVGSAFDRLSILALRVYHLRVESEREGLTQPHRDRTESSLSVATAQQTLLAKSLQTLIDEIVAGRKRHQTFKQLKMYNDPSLNPVLYNRAGA